MKRYLYITLITLSLVACGDPGPTVEEAYKVGYDMGIADECGRQGVRKEPMPSAYDDSLDEGVLEEAFQSGYWDARHESRPCKYD